MAENETLDLKDRYSVRWRALRSLVAEHPNVGAVSEETVRCLYATAKNLVKLLPLDELLAAAAGENGPVADIVARCPKGRDYAQLFELQEGRGLTKQEVMTNVLVAAVDTIFDQISHSIVPSNELTYTSLRSFLGQGRQEAMDEIGQLAARLVDNPREAPRMPALSEAAKEERSRQLANMSLLGK